MASDEHASVTLPNRCVPTGSGNGLLQASPTSLEQPHLLHGSQKPRPERSPPDETRFVGAAAPYTSYSNRPQTAQVILMPA